MLTRFSHTCSTSPRDIQLVRVSPRRPECGVTPRVISCACTSRHCVMIIVRSKSPLSSSAAKSVRVGARVSRTQCCMSIHVQYASQCVHASSFLRHAVISCLPCRQFRETSNRRRLLLTYAANDMRSLVLNACGASRMLVRPIFALHMVIRSKLSNARCFLIAHSSATRKRTTRQQCLPR